MPASAKLFRATSVNSTKILLVFVVLLSSCSRNRQASAPPAKAEAKEPLKATVWTDRGELYLEYPALVAGQKERFAIHLTRLVDFKAVKDSKIGELMEGAAAPIFNEGRTRVTVRLAESVERELVINYERAIHRALRDVSDALAGYHKTGEQRAQQCELHDRERDFLALYAAAMARRIHV